MNPLISSPSCAAAVASRVRKILYSESLQAIFVGVTFVGLIFYQVLASRFQFVVGDSGDSRFITLILENWFQSLCGNSSWHSPPFFYPTPGTLGYSDAVFLYLIFYVPFRFLKADPLLSYQLTIMSVFLIGFVASYSLSRIFRVSRLDSYLIALLVIASNGTVMALGHGQLMAVLFLPAVFWLMCYSQLQDHAPSNFKLLLAGLLLGLIFFTSFYIGWFALLATLTLIVVTVLLLPRQLWKTVSEKRRLAYVFTIGFMVGLVPFAITYGPLILSNVKRNYSEVEPYLLTPMDFLNLGSGNFIWGKIIEMSKVNFVHAGSEYMMMPTPMLIFAAICLSWYPFRQTRIPATFAFAGLAVALLAVQVRGISFWNVIFDFVPGASAIRAVGRIGLLSSLLFFGSIILSVSTFRSRERRTRLAGSVFLVILLFEQLNSGMYLSLNRSQQESWPRISTAPTSCKVFYVEGTNQRANYEANIDAMVIALNSGIPTINGYSGIFPDKWKLYDVNSDSYDVAVTRWVRLHKIEENLCSFNIETRTWSLN